MTLSFARLIRRLAVFSLLFSTSLVFANTASVAWNTEDKQWKSLHSQHFEVIFQEGHGELGNRAAAIAEKALVKLSDFFMWMPKSQIRMVLVDDFDLSNGWATPLPYNQMRLFISPPDSLNSLENYDDWLKLLITHELTHVMHMDLAVGTPNKLRSVFGRLPLLFPHALTPSFFLEGLAVYQETDFDAGIGRGQSSLYKMMMQTEVETGLLTLNDVISPRRDWPNSVQYLYGYYFYKYLSETYGEKRVQIYVQAYARNVIPYFIISSTAKKIFGKNFHQIWPEFQTWLAQEFPVADKQLTNDGQQLTNDGYSLEISSSNSSGYYYVQSNGQDHQSLMFIDHQGETSLFKTEGIQDIDVNDNNNNKTEILATRLIPAASGHLWADIFTYDLQGNETRLTEKQRYRNVRWLNDSQILAKRIVDGLSQLDILDRQGNLLKTLWQGSHDDVLGGFDVNDQGDIIASLKQKNKTWQLAGFDMQQQTWTTLTQTKAIENNPVFINTNEVIYSADYDGVFNIYQIDINNPESIQKLSQVTQGAFKPQQVNGQIYYQGYGKNGYNHFNLGKVSPFTSLALSKQTPTPNFNLDFTLQGETRLEDYNPLPTLAPHYWAPSYFSSSTYSALGIQTSGQDALGRHEYALNISYDSDNKITDGSLLYQYNNKYILSYSKSSSYYVDQFDTVRGIRRKDSVALIRTNVFNAFEDQLALHAGAIYQHESDEENADLIKVFQDTDESLVGLALTFNNVEQYQSSFSSSWGRDIKLIAETNEVLPSFFTGHIFRADWREYIDLPGDQVLALRAAGAYGSEYPRPFTLGGEPSLMQEPLFGKQDYALRGYKSDLQFGNRLQLNSIEYRFPLVRVEKNWDFIPLGMGDISGNLFVDSGATWIDDNDINYLTGVGLELNTEITLFYRAAIPVRLGYAKGLDSELGEERVYVSLGQSF